MNSIPVPSIPIRPGTDAALIMALMRIAVETRRYDEAYVRSFTNAAFLVDVNTKKLVRKGADYLVWDERQGGAMKRGTLRLCLRRVVLP